MREVLIIDDNRSSSILKNVPTDWGYSPIIVDTVDDGLRNLSESEGVKVVLLSVALSWRNGRAALRRIKAEHPEVIVIVIKAGIQTIRRATRSGALEVLLSPLDMEELREALDRAFVQLSNRINTFSTPEDETLRNRHLSLERAPRCVPLIKKLDLQPVLTFQCCLRVKQARGKGWLRA